MQMTEIMAVDFINKVIEEMTQDGIKFKEIIQEIVGYGIIGLTLIYVVMALYKFFKWLKGE